MTGPGVSWVLLTMGDRPEQLAAAIGSIPRDDATEVVVVANGAGAAAALDLPEGVRVVDSPTNLGIPGGRNLGVAESSGELVAFLDDDAAVVEPAGVRAAMARFRARPDLGLVAMRIVDPVTGQTARRHVPRLRVGDAARSGPVTAFLGGACIVRRRAFEAAGGYPAEFFYALEETDLAWRLVDQGWAIHYAADALVHHPATDISRHGHAHVRTARNRVLVARRLLPAPIAPVYVGVWAGISLVRGRSVAALRDWVAGTREGLRAPVERRPIGWRTVWRLTRLGRPPVI